MKLTQTTRLVSAGALLFAGAMAGCSSDDSTPANTGGGAITDASDASTTTVLFDFDNSTDGGTATGWATFIGDPADSGVRAASISISTTEGHNKPGALETHTPFAVYSQNEAANFQYNFGATPGAGGARDFTGKTKLHFWIKLQLPEGGTVSGLRNIAPFVQSGNPDGGGYNYFRGTYLGSAVYADGGWHEMIVDLTPDPTAAMPNFPFPNDVNQIGIQVQADDVAADASTPSPATWVVFVDDITLE